MFKKRHASDCQKKISFVEIIHLKFTFLTPDDIGISKLVSQLKLLSSLFEFKDNDTNDMSTIIKKLQDKEEIP